MSVTDCDIQELIRVAVAGDRAAVLDALLPASRSTVATRKRDNVRAIAEFDLDRLLALQEKMAKLIDTLTANELSADGGVLDGQKAAALMGEYLDERDITEFLAARREMIRQAVFDHLDEVGESELPVPEHGKKFCRDGGGYGTPRVDEQRLQALLGDRWIDACEEVIIPPQPERIEYQLSLEKLLAMGREDPAVLETLRSCLVPGKPQTPRFVVRDL